MDERINDGNKGIMYRCLNLFHKGPHGFNFHSSSIYTIICYNKNLLHELKEHLYGRWIVTARQFIVCNRVKNGSYSQIPYPDFQSKVEGLRAPSNVSKWMTSGILVILENKEEKWRGILLEQDWELYSCIFMKHIFHGNTLYICLRI